MASQFATNFTRKAYSGTGTSGELAINSENPVQIYSIVLTTGATSILYTLRDADENIIGVLRPAVSQSTTFSSSFMASNGLTIEVDATTNGADITVFHS